MKILLINVVCGILSTGRIVADLYKVLRQQQHACLVAYGRGQATADVESLRIGSDLDICAHGLYTRLTDKHGFASSSATEAFLRRVDAYQPDLVNLHVIHGYYLNVELLFNYLKSKNIPIVWTFHDCWAFTGHCTYFDYAGCERWRTACHDCPQKSVYPSSLLFDNSSWNYQRKKELFSSQTNLTIVTPSQWLASLVKQSFLARFPVAVINNGIDLTVFKPTGSELRQKYGWTGKFVLLGVTNHGSERKGMKYLVELSQVLGDDYQVVLVGITKEQKKKLPANVVGLERTNNTKELAELYSLADVFINPTLEDNFPTTNLEALACGTPVITFKTGGSVEAVDETCGLVVEKGDNVGLLDSVRKLKERNFSRQACVERAKRFDKQERCRDYADLYDEILRRG